MELESYSNDLHEALIKKDNTAFWNSWRSKFEIKSKCTQVNGNVDPVIIADNFASHFKSIFSANDPIKAETIRQDFLQSRADYHGLPLTGEHCVDTELVSNMINNMKRGKAADTDGISAEHLLFCHPCLSILLAKLFQLMIFMSYIPEGFRYSYIVHTP